MFDIGFPEFFLAAVVALLVLGPERLPAALRTLGLWIGRLRRSYYNVKTEIEREIGMDEVRRQLHNEQVMADVQRAEREVKALGEDVAGQTVDEPVLANAAESQQPSEHSTSSPASPPSPANPSPAEVTTEADEARQVDGRTVSN